MGDCVVGEAVGDFVVGEAVGTLVGDWVVGVPVGWGVGEWVGKLVMRYVGDGVGASVEQGRKVPSLPQHSDVRMHILKVAVLLGVVIHSWPWYSGQAVP